MSNIYKLDDYGDVLTVKDLCKILGIGKNTAYMWLQEHVIPNKKIMQKYIIPKQGVISFLNNCIQ